MKNLLYLFFTVIILSCQKEKGEGEIGTGEQNLTNVSYGSDGAQKMDIYLPKNRSSDTTKVIVLIHGGAWSQDDKSFFQTYIPTLKAKLPNYAIANINYRLATTATNHFPTQENDVKAAINFLIQKNSEYKISNKIVLLGVSAGAHLAMLQAYKNSAPDIAAVVDFFGPVNMVDMYNNQTDPFNQFAFQVLLGGTPATNPTMYQQSSPLNFVNAQSPPTIIFHGTADDYVSIDQSHALQTKLQTSGVPVQMVIYPGEGHGWFGAKMDDSINKMVEFLKTHVQ